ncbi:hypothetical protein GCM10023220_18880 [Streptomyces ziwulingensis]|uniref:Uncharacterized protein n=1 Tax=Streptomyces ziwulingensis TaxID=1045501 RepID=A0ABP9BBA0_9ACTN
MPLGTWRGGNSARRTPVRAAFLPGGARGSARAHTVMVLMRIAALVLFCAVGVQGLRAGSHADFMPLGTAGAGAAGATLFFSYIGLGSCSTSGTANAAADSPRRK